MDKNRHKQLWDQLVEIRRRRPLTADESARLNDCIGWDPDLRARWEEELALTGALRDLRDVPLPSNFNATVWAAVERADAKGRVRRGRPIMEWLVWRRPALAYAVCALVLVLGGIGYGQYQSLNRARMAASVADISRSVKVAGVVAELPPVEMLENFEAIYRLSQVSSLADEELLLVLE